ncbi:hypothetical protein BXZ70DRAFT_957481 [Cristinia sonorae]|uniref:RanBP2-type domain-containing protein n=1 Tax=Cristinia sonorae TaxID=1940300 RepID=A0A8K0UGJ1_9AGAR|nr:hypothetical protein BXZ70DRAFT_957481 [Cristinia sonorae]
MSSLALSAEPFGRSAASYSPPWHSSNNDLRLERLPSFNPASRDAVIHQHYNISSNPPNPKLSFRAGDWWCPVAHCAAHNFGRNVGCIKCGTPRASNGAHPGSGHHSIRTSPPPQISPRFINHPSISDDVGNMLEHRLPPQHVMRTQLPPVNNQGPSAQSLNVGSRAPAPQYPILTPSGSALSAGGRVRNVSNDPLSPCILYWPDNEPLPEPGQVRPFGSAVIQFPPIINTGNKGAAEKQPGDWICQKCKYLNWRRRKVCQTCFPYAEGNGDSISSAVQAERIALLAGVLNKADPSPVVQRQLPPPLNGYARESSQIWPDASVRVVPRPEVPTKIQQIYQTPDSISYSSHAVRKEFLVSQTQTYATPTVSRNLLPSFLQDIVHSPALSPAGSTSSSETGLEESFAAFDISDSLAAAARLRRHPYSTSSSSSVSSTSIGSIWKLDGEESKVLGLGNVSPMEKAASAAFASYA